MSWLFERLADARSSLPGGQAFLERVQQMQQSQPTSRPMSFEGSVLYDRASDTYIVPNVVGCGPSGCIPL